MSTTNIRLPDPFTDADAPGFQSAPLIDNEPIIQDELPGGKVIQVRSAAQFWGINITYPDLYEEEYRIIASAVNESKRTGKNIEVVLPQYIPYRVTGDLTQTVIPAGQKGSSINIRHTSHLEGRPYIGDLFQISGHPKVYKITGIDIEADEMTLYLYPDLFIETIGVEKPNFNDVRFQVALIGREQIIENYSVDGLYTDISYSFRETL